MQGPVTVLIAACYKYTDRVLWTTTTTKTYSGEESRLDYLISLVNFVDILWGRDTTIVGVYNSCCAALRSYPRIAKVEAGTLVASQWHSRGRRRGAYISEAATTTRDAEVQLALQA